MSKPGFALTTRAAGVLSAVALLALASACSSSGKSSSPPSPSSPPSSSSSPSSPAAPSSPSSPSTPAPPSTSGTTVNTGSATVAGTRTTVLTAPDGHTLYYFTPDTSGGRPTCTGSCASIWPPLKAASPSTVPTVTGTLSLVSGQVVYNGHPLYEYSGDSAAGQAKGEGFMGKWYVATPTLQTGAGPANPMPSSPMPPNPMPSSPSTSGGGSGGYRY